MKISLIAAIVMAWTAAFAAPGDTRVVLADPDPELLRAVEQTLAPWRFEIVVDATAPTNTAEAAARASAQAARFVVWRRGSDLVVFDRERGAAEYREGKAGALDPLDAAASALTVKTLMRLPTQPEPHDIGAVAVAPTPVHGSDLRVQVGAATRFTASTYAEIGARIGGAALLRPPGALALRVGIASEFGSRADIRSSGFKGIWSDWTLFALATYTIARGRWELEPHLGAGIARSRFEGMESSTAREDTRTLAAFRIGAWGRWRVGRFTFGPGIDLDVVPGAPTYLKQQGNGTLFAVPRFGFEIRIFAAADFGR